MSHSTRVIFAFLLTFCFSLPQNVLSIDYPNPWICDNCDEQFVAFYTPSMEKFNLKFTGNTIEAFSPVTTNNTLTGGIFGKTLYRIYKINYYWKTCYLTYIFTLQVNVIYFNTKYDSYQNALNYPDGIVQVNVPIFANGIIDNPLFYKFEQAFNQIKSNPGKITCILNKELISWIVQAPLWVPYSYYKSFYIDEDTGKSYPCATTVNLPLVPFLQTISCRQYLNTFGSLVDSSRKPLNNPPPLTIPTSLIGVGWFIKVLDVVNE